MKPALIRYARRQLRRGKAWRWLKDHAAIVALVISTVSTIGTVINSHNSAANLEMTANNTRDQRLLQYLQLKYASMETLPRISLATHYEHDSVFVTISNVGKGPAFNVRFASAGEKEEPIINMEELAVGASVTGVAVQSELRPGAAYLSMHQSNRGVGCLTIFAVDSQRTFHPIKEQACSAEFEFLIADQLSRKIRLTNGTMSEQVPPKSESTK